ncbi:Drug/metabolite transporter [Corchorus olitorius]|uniref:WAT1-related protein n=1 Tax=Corchorus olitorius TaxID=93759 RepID=A0A1R3JQ20_9ROSI|nr:Drug/metabolite transporter [Corchorus olitorius]
MTMAVSASIYNQATPYLAMIFMRFGSAGMSIVAKFALNKGMSQHVLVVYRFAIATVVLAPFAFVFDRKVRPKMTLSVFLQILLLGLLEPVIDQNLYYTGMKYTTATVATALCNVLPAFVFLLAWGCRLQFNDCIKFKVDMTWEEILCRLEKVNAFTLKSYPAELSLTTLVCLMGTIEGAIVALVIEGNNAAAWSIHWDSKLFAAVYSGVVCSGIAYYIGAVVIQAKGPVFYAAFNPLTMVIVAIMSSFIFSEIMFLGRVIGAIVIVFGLYLVLWAKSKDQHIKSSDSDVESNNKAALSVEQMATINDTSRTSNQDFVLLDVRRVTLVDDHDQSITNKENQKQIP